jgi:hypothetical protein
MVSVWRLETSKQLYETLVTSDRDIEMLVGGSPQHPPLDIENRIHVTDDAFVYLVYTTGMCQEVANVPHSMVNISAARILLDQFLFDTSAEIPSDSILFDCPYGSVVLVRTDHQLNLINYPWHLLCREWGQFFKRGCPYFSFSEDLLHDPSASTKLEQGYYDSPLILSKYMKEPPRNTGGQRQRIEQVYHGVYLFFMFYSVWKDLPNPTNLKIRRLNYADITNNYHGH